MHDIIMLESANRRLKERLAEAESERDKLMDSMQKWERGGHLARVIACAKAEALEEVNAHDISREAKAAGKDAWDMNPVGISKIVNSMGERYRRQLSEDEE